MTKLLTSRRISSNFWFKIPTSASTWRKSTRTAQPRSKRNKQQLLSLNNKKLINWKKDNFWLFKQLSSIRSWRAKTSNQWGRNLKQIWQRRWLERRVGPLKSSRTSISKLKATRVRAATCTPYWKWDLSSERSSWKWASMKCPQTDSLKALSGTSMPCSNPKVIQLETSMILSSWRTQQLAKTCPRSIYRGSRMSMRKVAMALLGINMTGVFKRQRRTFWELIPLPLVLKCFTL